MDGRGTLLQDQPPFYKCIRRLYQRDWTRALLTDQTSRRSVLSLPRGDRPIHQGMVRHHMSLAYTVSEHRGPLDYR